MFVCFSRFFFHFVENFYKARNSVNYQGFSSRCLCIVERTGLSVYSYMGRLLASPKWGARPETLGRAGVSLGPDSLAAIDQSDRKRKFK